MKDASQARARRRRLRVLLGVLAALAIARVIAPWMDVLGNLAAWGDAGLPSWTTEEAVREALDGQTVAVLSRAGSGTTVDLLAIRKAGISSLRVPSWGDDSISLRFDLDQQGRRYRVEGSLSWIEYRMEGVLQDKIYSFDGTATPAGPEGDESGGADHPSETTPRP